MNGGIIKSFANNIVEELIEQKYMKFVENRKKDEEIEAQISGCSEFENEIKKLQDMYKHDCFLQCSIEKLDSLKNEIVSEKGYFKYLEGFKLGIEFSKAIEEILKSDKEEEILKSNKIEEEILKSNKWENQGEDDRCFFIRSF